MTTHADELWIGLVELSGSPDNPILDGSPGAFANYLVCCKDISGFRNFAEQSALELGLAVKEVVWAEAYETRRQRDEFERYLYELANQVRETGNGRFGRFHVWEPEL